MHSSLRLPFGVLLSLGFFPHINVAAASQTSWRNVTTSASMTSCWPATSTDSQCLPTTSVSRAVTVGADGFLQFNPIEINANIGDVIEFTFLKLNHTLTQSTLYHPCANIGGFSTGFNQFNPLNDSGKFVVKYPVTTLDPQWFFCAQTQKLSHCQAGMVFALNAAGELDKFRSAAAAISSNTVGAASSSPTSSNNGGVISITLPSAAASPSTGSSNENSILFSQTSTSTPNSTVQTAGPRVLVTPTTSMGREGGIAVMVSTLALLLATMLVFVSM